MRGRPVHPPFRVRATQRHLYSVAGGGFRMTRIRRSIDLLRPYTETVYRWANERTIITLTVPAGRFAAHLRIEHCMGDTWQKTASCAVYSDDGVLDILWAFSLVPATATQAYAFGWYAGRRDLRAEQRAARP